MAELRPGPSWFPWWPPASSGALLSLGSLVSLPFFLLCFSLSHGPGEGHFPWGREGQLAAFPNQCGTYKPHFCTLRGGCVHVCTHSSTRKHHQIVPFNTAARAWAQRHTHAQRIIHTPLLESPVLSTVPPPCPWTLAQTQVTGLLAWPQPLVSLQLAQLVAPEQGQLNDGS